PVTYAPAEMLSSRRRMLDAIGLALAAALAMWASVTAIGRTGARPLAFVGGVLLAVGAFVAGRRLMAWRAAAPSLVVAGAALLGAVIGRARLTESGGPPLRYANANAALFALGALALAAAVAGAVAIASRPVPLAAVIMFTGLTAITHSVGGVLVLALGAVIAVAGRWLAGPLAVTFVVLVLAVTSALAVATPQR